MGLTPFIPSRKFPLQHKDDNTPNSDDSTEIGNENYWQFSSNDDSTESENENHWQLSYMLFTPTLEDLKNVLYVALNPYFEEFEIEVVSCPCLTRAPYNLAAAGLSGNTGTLKLGNFGNFYPRPQIDIAFDMKDILSTCSYDAFVIGSGFAVIPAMPCNGHLTMNAIVSANPTNVINNSSITYEVNAHLLKLKPINDHNQIKCSLLGQFFFTESKRGPVIKMRAKGRRSRSNIIALIQSALANLCRYERLIGLGIVLVINGGQTKQLFLPDDFVRYCYNEVQDYYDQLRYHHLNCENLIALGALISQRLTICQDNKKVFLQDVCSIFNTHPNSKSFGNFFNDITPEETEYIVYINIAQERCFNNVLKDI